MLAYHQVRTVTSQTLLNITRDLPLAITVLAVPIVLSAQWAVGSLNLHGASQGCTHAQHRGARCFGQSAGILNPPAAGRDGPWTARAPIAFSGQTARAFRNEVGRQKGLCEPGL